MTSVLLDTLKVKTDPFAGLASDNVSFTHAKVKFTNPSKTEAEFRVTRATNDMVSSVISVPGGGDGEITVFPLSPGTSTKLFLERLEVDTWVTQTSASSLDYVLVSTPTSNLSVAVGSTSAKVTFPIPVSNAAFLVAIKEDGTSNHQLGSVARTGSSGTVFFTGLKKNQKYKVQLGIKYPQSIIDEFSDILPDDEGVTLHSLEFTTSRAAEMDVTGPFASYMGVDWSASVDGQGSNYRIVNRVVGKSDDVLVESSTETKATIEDLQPGTEYRIILQRKEHAENWSDQSEVAATTLTSSLSLASVASKTLELNWTPMYSGASYEIMYSAGSGSPTGNGQTQGLSSVLRNLKAGTDYELNLVVYELGQAVGLARLGMTTNKGLFSASNLKLATIALLIVFLVSFLIRKGS